MGKNEGLMRKAVARFLRTPDRQIRVGDCILDVVAYDKKGKAFKVVECKLASHASSIGRAFGQLAAYAAVLTEAGFEFVDAFGKTKPMRPRRLAEATDGWKQIRIEFFVALTDEACQQTPLLRSLKTLLPLVGIIRYRKDGTCTQSVKEDGKRNRELAKARPTIIKIEQPAPTDA